MIDMSWVLVVVDQLNNSERQSSENQERILEELEEIKKRVRELGQQLDECVLVGARSGLRHLVDGMNSETEAVRNDEFRLSRAEFNKLVNLNPEGTTEGTSEKVPNIVLIGLGYFGNFHYFNLRGEKRNALIQVYECTQKYPYLGLLLFSPKFFSKNYEKLIEENKKNLIEVQNTVSEKQGENFWQGLSFYARQTLRVAATGIVGVGGVALAGGTGGLLGHAVMAATKKTFEALNPSSPHYQDTIALQAKVVALTEERKKYFAEVVEESKIRQQDLQKYTLENLMNMAKNP